MVLALIVLSLVSGSGRLPPTAPGLIAEIGPVARSCQGVAVTPADDVQALIDAHPPATTFCLSAGTYRLETPLEPKRGDALIGHRGAVLSGSKVLTDWRLDGRLWVANGFLPAAFGTHGQCMPSAPQCAFAEDVFFDKRRLERVASPAAVVPGTVYADYSTNTIIIGADPRSHLVEQAVAPSLVRAAVDEVTVANLVLEQAANEAQVGAVDSRRISPYFAGSGWRILNNEVRLNHGVGIGFAGASIVRGNHVHHQGQLGFSAWAGDSILSNNEISFNGTAGYSAEWEAGGGKSWLTTRLKLVHNHVHGNMGPGLWADGGNIDMTYEYNRIDDNWGAGIQHEISYDALIRYNDINRNGRRHKGWAWEAGIQIQSSGGIDRIEVAHNVVRHNANGITLIDSGDRTWERPAPHGPHVVRNVWVHDNVVTMVEDSTTGAVEDTGDRGIFTTRNNRFDANTYYLPALTGPYFSWFGEDMEWSRWRGSGSGNDVNGRVERAD
ncbi:right-handed parallel beta-helix repeat-containing protein [Pseudonocardia hispaniensis]|uniref:Right-handed parallel beta-helix repeat-containing protein n=1 Tax=Pseudonocardia hispaniensis TaxID=904933 RepID=A0ABW1IZN1_9PSEU